jgi:hypothetical protein
MAGGYPASVDLDDPTNPLVGGLHIAGADAGAGISSVGDVNGDGIADLLVSVDVAESFYPDFANYIVYGGFRPDGDFDLGSLDGSNGFRIEARPGYDTSAAVGAGDVNGDGLADIAFVTARHISGQPTVSDVHVVFGSTSSDGSIGLGELDGDNGFTLTGAERTSFDLTAGGDINGDGYDELLVGGTGGFGFVFGGDSFAPTAAVADVAPLDFYRHLGPSAGLGDINGDGYDDIAAGHVVWYGRDPDESASPYRGPFKDRYTWLETTNPANGQETGDVSSAGDVNGDGYEDFIISRSATSPQGQAQAGETWVVFGRPGMLPGVLQLDSLNGSNGFVLRGERMEQVGTEVSGAGDLNGDGFADIVVTRQDGEEAYVVYGRAHYYTSALDIDDLDGSNGFVLSDPGTAFLVSPAGIGDFDGDGFDDLALGERPYGIDTESDVHILWGLKPTEAVTRIDGKGDNTVRGGDFDDTLISYGGNDRLIGGLGNDRLVSAQGTDTLDGGLGDDTYVVYRDHADTIIDAGGIDKISAKTSWDLTAYPEIENLEFSTAGNWLGRGNSLDNAITAGAGDNRLFGAEGNDTLSAGAGNDQLSGGIGDDLLSGGIGSDRFDFTGADVGDHDIIADFTTGRDTINLGAIDADTTRASNQAFQFVGEDAFSGTAGELRYGATAGADGGDATLVEGDVDGDGVADFQLELRGLHALTAGDFIL